MFFVRVIQFALFSLIALQKGPGREEEILDELVKNLPDFTIIGGSSLDDNEVIKNYQFFNNNVLENSVVALGIKSDLNILLNTSYGLNKTDRSFKVTQVGGAGKVIEKLNDKPATEEFLNVMKWPKYFLDERIHRKTLFTPLGYIKKNRLFPIVIGAFWGHSILCARNIESDEVSLFFASGKSLIDAIDENTKKFKDKDNLLAFIVSCIARLETLGCNVFIVREKLLDFFGDVPFLLMRFYSK